VTDVVFVKTCGSPLGLAPSRVMAALESYGITDVFWSWALNTTLGLVVLLLGTPGRSAVVPYLVCKSVSFPKSSALIGHAMTHAGSMLCCSLSTHIVHFDAFDVGESLSKTIAPYGQAAHAAFRFALEACVGSIRTAP